MTAWTYVGRDIDGTELHMGDRVCCVNSTDILFPGHKAYFHNPQDTFTIVGGYDDVIDMCDVCRCSDGKNAYGWDSRRFRKISPIPPTVTRRLTVKVNNRNE